MDEYKTFEQPKLQHFQPKEFRAWYKYINTELLLKLDKLRELADTPINISPAHGAIGREDGSHSMHNLKRWHEIRAIDVMFPKLDNLQYAFIGIVKLARLLGFTGIGYYSQWYPHWGLHLDIRIDTLKQWEGSKNENGEHVYTVYKH